MSRRHWTLLLVLAALWGASYLFIKIGLRDLSPAMVVLIRVACGAAVLVPIALHRGAFAGARPLLGVLVLVAAIQVAAPFMLISLGEQEVSSALAGILVASAPIWTAVLAVFFDPEERSQGLRLLGVLVGIGGVGLLLGLDLGGSSGLLLGGLAIVLAALGYAVGGLILKRRLGSLQPLGTATIVLAIATVLIAPFALASAPTEAPGAGPLLASVALGVLGTGAAFAIFYSLIAAVGPARTFVVTYLAPGFAVLYGALLLDEAVSVATLGGLLLILGGSYLAAEGRLPGRRRRAADPEPCPADAGSSGFAPARGE
jgi:drug/metabolite transporter (DMT)-like permease